MVQRQRSVPAESLTGRGQKASLPSNVVVVQPPSASSASVAAAASNQLQQQQQQQQNQKQPTAGSGDARLLAQADALARMTVELNLRAVGAQADRLEEELKELVVRTGQDAEFRRQHEGRMTDVWREIVAVKAQMEHVKGRQDDFKVDFERCRRETADLQLLLQREMGGLKDLVDSVASQLDSLPTEVDLEDDRFVMSSAGAGRTQEIATTGTGTTTNARGPGRCIKDCASQPPKRRVQEAISSTRRWHRDHKTTTLPDSEFVANYLKQQSKRDPTMAVFIQKAIQKRMQHGRRPRASSRPRSLEDFCRDVTWRDVIETVEMALVREKEMATRVLSQEGGKTS